MAELKATFGEFVPQAQKENPWTQFVAALKEATDKAIVAGGKPVSAIVEIPTDGLEKSLRLAREAANDADRTLRTVAQGDAVKVYGKPDETYKPEKGNTAVEVRLVDKLVIVRKPKPENAETAAE